MTAAGKVKTLAINEDEIITGPVKHIDRQCGYCNEEEDLLPHYNIHIVCQYASLGLLLSHPH